MGKYATGLVKEYEAKLEFKEKQERIKKKNKLELDESIVVVEKNSTLQFLIKLCISAIKTIITLAVFSLSTVGIISFVYPAPRKEIFAVFEMIIEQLKAYLPI
ncbi:MAG: hypothetical protein ACRCUS_02405 [Anaerovoracaceae bacterium]